MYIFSKTFLMVADNTKYSAFILLKDSYINVNTLGINEDIDINTTFGSCDDSEPCDHVIINGKLYYYTGSTLSQIGTSDKWSAVCGNGNYGIGINNGALYLLSGNSATLKDSTYNWILVSAGRNSCEFGIYKDTNNAQRLAAIKITGSGTGDITYNVGSSTGWNSICGASYIPEAGTSYYAYGIKGSDLYYLTAAPSATLISSLGSVSKITGYSSNNGSYFGGAITTTKKLYKLAQGTATQIGSATNWKDISGNFSHNSGMAINESGQLFAVSGYLGTVTQIGSLTGWTDIAGGVVSGGYAINNKNLYYISSSNPSFMLSNCVKVMGQSTSSMPALAICTQ